MQLTINYLPPNQLRPYEKNARTHSPAQVQQIARSIREFGFTNPILASDSNIVIAGHGRLEAALAMGLPVVPVIHLGHLSDRQARALTLADNKIAINSGWDFAKLSDELSALAEFDMDLELTGFDEQEISALLQDDPGILPPSWSGESQQPARAPEQANAPPSEFKGYDEGIGFDYCCPKCRFVWSGKPK